MLLAGRIVQLESQLSVASRRLKFVSRLLLLASALLLLAMLWWALLAKSVDDDTSPNVDHVSACDADPIDLPMIDPIHPILAIDPIVAIDPTEWNGTNCTAVYGTFQLDDVQALLDARLAHAARLEGLGS